MELLLGYSGAHQQIVGVSSLGAGEAKGKLLGACGISGMPLFGDCQLLAPAKKIGDKRPGEIPSNQHGVESAVDCPLIF